MKILFFGVKGFFFWMRDFSETDYTNFHFIFQWDFAKSKLIISEKNNTELTCKASNMEVKNVFFFFVIYLEKPKGPSDGLTVFSLYKKYQDILKHDLVNLSMIFFFYEKFDKSLNELSICLISKKINSRVSTNKQVCVI